MHISFRYTNRSTVMFSKPLLRIYPEGYEKKRQHQPQCVICEEDCEETDAIKSNQAWATIKENAQKWVGLDRYGNIYTSIAWNAGWKGHYAHRSCKTYLGTSKTLNQAISRKSKEEVIPEASLSQFGAGDALPQRQSRANMLLHDPELCVWCLKPEDTRHKDRPNSKLSLIDSVSKTHI